MTKIMKKLLARIFKDKKRYSFNRKYALKQYENIDLYVEGLETREEMVKELECFDEMAKAYRKKEEDTDRVEIEKINKEVNNQTNETIQQRPF